LRDEGEEENEVLFALNHITRLFALFQNIGEIVIGNYFKRF